jgi:hypothetical protein
MFLCPYCFTHQPKKVFPNNVEQVECIDKVAMKTHMIEFHPTFSHSCDECNIAFETLGDRVYHTFMKCPMDNRSYAQQVYDYNVFLKNEEKKKHAEKRNMRKQSKMKETLEKDIKFMFPLFYVGEDVFGRARRRRR